MSDDFAPLPATGQSGDQLDARSLDGHLLIVESIAPGQPWKSKYPPYEEKESYDVNVADIDTGDIYRRARFFDGSLVDPMKALGPGKKVAVRLSVIENRDKTGKYPALAAATGDDLTRCKQYKDSHPDMFGDIGSLPAEQPAPGPQPVAQPSAEQVAASALGATPVQEAALAGPTPQDIATAKTLIGVPGIEDSTILASCPSLNPAIVASLRTAATS